MPTSKPYTIAIAGTTHRTRQCAEVLFKSALFEIIWIMAPTAKRVGRKQILTSNPMEIFAQQHTIPTVLVEKKIDSKIQNTVLQLPQPDLLLVVDFGYIIPNWLLKLPKIAPLNIHPSELPKWRGSSPGQFALLFNEVKSGITLMVMDEKLDHGPIVHQDFFAVNPTWNQEEYYANAFTMMCENLDQKIASFAKNPHVVTPQPELSPTVTAKQVSKEQTFVPWHYIELALAGRNIPETSRKKNSKLPDLLQMAYDVHKNLALTLNRATKAFSSWPGVWTLVPTQQGEKRMKLLETELQNNKLILRTVLIEGKNQSKWETARSIIYGNT